MVEKGAACPHTSSKGAQRQIRPRRPRATTATGRSRRGRSRRSSRTWLSTSARPVPRTRTAAARRPSSRPRIPGPSSRRALLGPRLLLVLAALQRGRVGLLLLALAVSFPEVAAVDRGEGHVGLGGALFRDFA